MTFRTCVLISILFCSYHSYETALAAEETSDQDSIIKCKSTHITASFCKRIREVNSYLDGTYSVGQYNYASANWPKFLITSGRLVQLKFILSDQGQYRGEVKKLGDRLVQNYWNKPIFQSVTNDPNYTAMTLISNKIWQDVLEALSR